MIAESIGDYTAETAAGFLLFQVARHGDLHKVPKYPDGGTKVNKEIDARAEFLSEQPLATGVVIAVTSGVSPALKKGQESGKKSGASDGRLRRVVRQKLLRSLLLRKRRHGI